MTEHIKGKTVQRRDGAVWTISYPCSCGEEIGSGRSKDHTEASRQALAIYEAHFYGRPVPTGPSPWERLKQNLASAAFVGIPAVLVLAFVVLVGTRVVGAFTDDDSDSTSDIGDLGEGSDIDCDKAVTSTMTDLYGGGWGSGNWPDGEYNERVSQCEGN